MNFSTRLKKTRSEKGLTLRQLSEMSGVSVDAISKYELGKRVPNMNAVIVLAKALDVTLEYLSGGESEMKDNYIVEVVKKYGLEAPYLNPSEIPDEDKAHFESDIVMLLKAIKDKYNL